MVRTCCIYNTFRDSNISIGYNFLNVIASHFHSSHEINSFIEVKLTFVFFALYLFRGLPLGYANLWRFLAHRNVLFRLEHEIVRSARRCFRSCMVVLFRKVCLLFLRGHIHAIRRYWPFERSNRASLFFVQLFFAFLNKHLLHVLISLLFHSELVIFFSFLIWSS